MFQVDSVEEAAGGTAVVRDRSANRSRKGVETRSRLLASAKEVFEARGYRAVRISDITDRAELAHGSFYHYFTSKDEIFGEIAKAVEDHLQESFDGTFLDLTIAAPRPEHVRQAFRAHLDRYRVEARIMGVIEQVARHDLRLSAVRQDRRRVVDERLATSLQALQRRGLADRRIDAALAASMLGSMTGRFCEHWLVEDGVEGDFEEVVDQFSRVFVNAIGLVDGQPSGRGPVSQPAGRSRRR